MSGPATESAVLMITGNSSVHVSHELYAQAADDVGALSDPYNRAKNLSECLLVETLPLFLNHQRAFGDMRKNHPDIFAQNAYEE